MELTGQWNAAGPEIANREKQIEDLQGEIAAWQAWRQQVETQAKVCWDFAALQGFDLAHEYAQAQSATQETVQDMIQAAFSAPKFDMTVREFILKEAEAAYPGPVHAAALRRKLKD